ncbi:MAG: hypothetical protein FWG34_07865 [Oscillospiraceae bacterium]|nr:hypothetical protein [Oscillospiraceae bacterium]
MLKKLLIIFAPITIFFVFLIIFVVFSNPESLDEFPETADITSDGGTKKENTADFAEIENETVETTAKNTEISKIEIEESNIVYDAPYGLDDIKNIFETDKILFESIKNIKMPDGCDYFQSVKPIDPGLPYKIEFYGFDGKGEAKYLSFEVGESGEYSELYKFFKKYGHMGFVHAIDPDSGQYSENELVAQFGLLINAPDNLDHVPWAEIRYNRTGGEIDEKITGEYMTVPLDEHWYYIYSNIYPNR